jgi:cytochrome c553
MVWMVSWLSDDYLREIAAHFASLHPPYPAPQRPPASAAQMARGDAARAGG